MELQLLQLVGELQSLGFSSPALLRAIAVDFVECKKIAIQTIENHMIPMIFLYSPHAYLNLLRVQKSVKFTKDAFPDLAKKFESVLAAMGGFRASGLAVS